jgi:hypothetical protein
MRKSVALPAIAALVLAGPAMADGFSYSYIEGALGGSDLEIDGLSGSADGEGGALGGAVEFGPHAFGFVNFTSLEYEDVLTIGSGSLGVGFNWPLSPKLDLVSGVSFERVRLEADGDDTSEDGYGLSVGLRGLIDETKISTFSLGGKYYVTPRFAIGADILGNNYEDDNDGAEIDESIVLVTFRYDFGKR